MLSELNGQSDLVTIAPSSLSSEVALIFMPSASVLQPSMALGQIQAQLLEAKQKVFSWYLNIEFARAFGVADYEIIGNQRGVAVQLGEWLFAEAAWGEPTAMPEAEFLSVADIETSALSHDYGDPIKRILDIRRELVPKFLDDAAQKLCAIPQLRVVGFSCMFFQTLPSIALSRRIKELRPEIKIVFGGPSMHGEMGRSYMEVLPWLDVVAIGEADRTIPSLFKGLIQGEIPSNLGDTLWREGVGHPIQEGGAPIPADDALLDALPVPDFTEYFFAMKQTGFLADRSIQERIYVPYETSRGCWWGQKKHCTFCGLNSLGMSYRSKSPERALEIISESRKRWGIKKLFAVDNILPQNYYETVLPALKEGPLSGDLEIFCEIKTNVTREKIKILADAGVKHIVPGIESLSSNMLRCIDKGVTALHNTYALKLFSEYGVMPGWGLLIRIPGERAEDYSEMTALVPKLVHLHPPFGGPRQIEMHRFSPYHFRSEKFVHSYKPQNWYQGLFPEGLLDINKVAYYFDAEWRDVVDIALHKPLSEVIWRWVDLWRDRSRTPKLTVQSNDRGGVDIFDSRADEKFGTWRLDSTEAALYGLLADPLPRNRFDQKAKALGLHESESETMLDEFLARDLVVELDGKLLALALPEHAPEPDMNYRRSVFRRVGEKGQRAAEKKEEKRKELALSLATAVSGCVS